MSQPKKNILSVLCSFYTENGIAGLSAQLSYYMLFTFFPILLCLNAFIGKIVPEGFELTVPNLVPEPIQEFAESYLHEISQSNPHTLLAAGVLLTLYSLTRYIRFFRLALKRFYPTVRPFSPIRDWLVSFLFSLGMLILFYVAVFSIFLSEAFLQKIGLAFISESLWYILRFLLVALYAFLVICGLQYTVAGYKRNFWYFAPGALCSVVIWTILSLLFSFYVEHYSHISVVYGPIGSMILLLLWLNMSNTILLMGNVVNLYQKSN